MPPPPGEESPAAASPKAEEDEPPSAGSLGQPRPPQHPALADSPRCTTPPPSTGLSIPDLPLPHQILVEVRYAALNPCDFKFRRLSLPYPSVTVPVLDFLFPKPKIPALDVSGTVVGVGPSVRRFAVGDRVAATQPIVHTRWGTLAQFAAVEEAHAARLPGGVQPSHKVQAHPESCSSCAPE